MRLSNLFKKALFGEPASYRNSGRPRRFVPELEALEDRQLLSGYSVHGEVLRITGSNAADTVAITDNGTGSAGDIRFSLNGSTTTISDYISLIKVDTGGGNDTVTYTLTGDLNLQAFGSGRHVWVDLGTGDDTFWGQAHHDLLSSDRDYGHFVAETLLDISVAGCKGKDTLSMSAYGNTGIKIHRNAMLNVLLDGGKGDHDLVTTNIIGELDGYVGLGLAGGPGNDKPVPGHPGSGGVYASLTLQAGSTGIVDAPYVDDFNLDHDTGFIQNPFHDDEWQYAHGAYVAGRSGDDDLTFRIYNYGTAHINAEIVGGTGHDSLHYTSNVRKV